MISENVEYIRKRIASACAKAKRDPEEITLVAVAKTFPADRIAEAVAAGIADIGENYVQEIREKREALIEHPIRWHFIGHLQTNKVKYIAPWVSCIHSVDSATLGGEISRQCERAGRRVEVLVEVNTTGETSKFGVHPEYAGELVSRLKEFPGIDVRGLMTIGPFDPDPEASRPAFRMLDGLRKKLSEEGTTLSECSMGMTNDFEVAIEEGATVVRIGTAIFGNRTRHA
jgi:pyridoxal phosphate enzyme (YggS family)